MTVVAFLLIFVSVFLHVTWNMLSKGTTPSPAFYSLMSFTAAAIWLPFFAVSDISLTQMQLNFYLLAAGSIAGEIIYMTGLAYGYKKSDISLVYPVVRALPVCADYNHLWTGQETGNMALCRHAADFLRMFSHAADFS